MKLGSLCTGIGGLDLAVEAHFRAELAWCAEIDPAASRVLAARFPGVENIGNFVGRDWSTVEPIDVLCAGYPCQPFSTAGRRLGEQDPRHLWPHVADAVRDLRPRWVVLENVRGHLVLGFPSVLGDLSALGYDVRWGCVRASDVGAPHRRERLFIAAADADRAGIEARFDSGHDGERSRVQPLGFAASATDPGSARAGWDSGAAPADADMRRRIDRDSRIGQLSLTDSVSAGADFGPYAAAVQRWEHLLGRVAPDPVDDRRRLNPAFVEWMMGFPAGWCTDILNRRTDALRCLGNAVVPQQAMHALALLDARVLAPA